MNNEKLQVAAKSALDNWDHDVSGYARICEAGLRAMLNTEFEQSEIDAHIKSGDTHAVYDQLSDWAHELGCQVLDKSSLFVYKALDVPMNEAKIRYSQMTDFEQELFATLYEESCQRMTWEEVLAGDA